MAPIISPLTKYLCRKGYTSRIGISTSTTLASRMVSTDSISLSASTCIMIISMSVVSMIRSRRYSCTVFLSVSVMKNTLCM